MAKPSKYYGIGLLWRCGGARTLCMRGGRWWCQLTSVTCAAAMCRRSSSHMAQAALGTCRQLRFNILLGLCNSLIRLVEELTGLCGALVISLAEISAGVAACVGTAQRWRTF